MSKAIGYGLKWIPSKLTGAAIDGHLRLAVIATVVTDVVLYLVLVSAIIVLTSLLSPQTTNKMAPSIKASLPNHQKQNRSRYHLSLRPRRLPFLSGSPSLSVTTSILVRVNRHQRVHDKHHISQDQTPGCRANSQLSPTTHEHVRSRTRFSLDPNAPCSVS